MRSILCIGIVLVFVALAGAVWAGPILDDALNYALVDQVCPADAGEAEGVVMLHRNQLQARMLSKENPLGQSFVVGSKADKLWKISLGIVCWEDNWQEGETVTFTLYDSPQKGKVLHRRVMPYAEKWHRWDIGFDPRIKTKPGTSYYFELTHNGGGDNQIAVAVVERDDYKAGKGYAAGVPQDDMDLYFQVLTKAKDDRIANLEKFFSRFNLDHKEMIEAKRAYLAKDYDKACAEILKVFENRLANAEWVWRPDPENPPSLERAELCIKEDKWYRDPKKKDAYVIMTAETNWRETWPNESGLMRQNDIFRELAWAYYLTKNEAYAKKMSGLMFDFMQDNATPHEGGMGGKRWGAMGQAWRINDAWSGFACALDSKGFIDDVRLAWLDYNGRMAHYAMEEPSGGNQANATADGLMQFATKFPYYKESSKWFDYGYKMLIQNSLDLFREDGGCKEPAMNYHGFSLATLLSGLETAKEFGVEPPQEVLDTIEKALTYTAYTLKPDGQIAPYGDTGIEEFRPNVEKWNGWREGEVMKCYEMFGREDCLYIATLGKKGKRPEKTSVAFKDTGSYIMRSDWGGPNGEGFEDARYLFLRGGMYGSHGHWDQNQVTLYAYGRPLLIDPGRTDYGTELMFELTRARSHNVLLVDDYAEQERPAPVLHAWHTNPVMDIADVSYEGLYPGVNHRRAVVFVRPDYWVMFDKATSDKPHNMGINFWMTPPELTIDKATCTVHSNEPNGSNLLLKVANRRGVEIVERKGTVDHAGEIRNDIPVVTFWRNGVEEADWATVMYPFPGRVDASSVKATYDPGVVKVENPNGIDLVFYTGFANGTVSNGANSCKAYSAVVQSGKGKFAFGWVEGSELVANGQKLASSASHIDELSVEYTADAVVVTTSAEEGSLEIATRGKTKAVVNGKETKISGEMFRPFK